MIKVDPKKVYKIPEDSLSNFSDYGLTIPFANMSSTVRQHMWHSHIKQTIIPKNPERPYVDTCYTKDILFSSDNTLLEGDITLVDKVEKVINNVVTSTTYIYYDHTKEKYYLEIIKQFNTYAKYAVPAMSEFSSMQIGETRRDIYSKYIEPMDTRDGGIAFGLNVPIIYDIDEGVGEDSIIMCKELAEKLTVRPAYDPVEITFNPMDELLLDRYGYLDDNGIVIYKPFPLPGEEVKGGEVAVVSKVAKDFMASSDDIVHASDTSYYVPGGTVTDIEVFSNYEIDNKLLENLRQIQMEYYRNIIVALSKLPIHKLSAQCKNYLSKLSSIVSNKLRFGTEELNRLVKIRIQIIGEEPMVSGAKMTNRYGGKGTVSEVIKTDKPFIGANGQRVLMKYNASGVSNRENISQQVEFSISCMNWWLRDYLKKTSDSDDVKYENILKWIEIARQPKTVEFFKKHGKEYTINRVTSKPLYIKYDPFDTDVNAKMLFEMTKFTKKLNPDFGPVEVTAPDGTKLGSKFMMGEVYMVVLENGPRKDNSMRSDRITSSKGGLSRVGLDKKKYHSKYLTTAVKQSDLAQNVMITAQFDSDKDLLNPDLSVLTRNVNAMGLDIRLKDNEEGE